MTYAIFTILQCEPFFFPIWLEYYLQYFEPDRIHVLNHVFEPHTDSQRSRRNDWDSIFNHLCHHHRFHRHDINYQKSFDHDWLRRTVQDFQRTLLKNNDVVMFTEIDEIVGIDSRYTDCNFREYLDCHFEQKDYLVTKGYEIVHKHEEEPELDLNVRPLLSQRNWMYECHHYSKPLISKKPLDWSYGFHASDQTWGKVQPSFEIPLLHLHKIDFNNCVRRNESNRDRILAKDGMGFQNLIDENGIRGWWYRTIDKIDVFSDLYPIPSELKNLV